MARSGVTGRRTAGLAMVILAATATAVYLRSRRQPTPAAGSALPAGEAAATLDDGLAIQLDGHAAGGVVGWIPVNGHAEPPGDAPDPAEPGMALPDDSPAAATA